MEPGNKLFLNYFQILSYSIAGSVLIKFLFVCQPTTEDQVSHILPPHVYNKTTAGVGILIVAVSVHS